MQDFSCRSSSYLTKKAHFRPASALEAFVTLPDPAAPLISIVTDNRKNRAFCKLPLYLSGNLQNNGFPFEHFSNAGCLILKVTASRMLTRFIHPPKKLLRKLRRWAEIRERDRRRHQFSKDPKPQSPDTKKPTGGAYSVIVDECPSTRKKKPEGEELSRSFHRPEERFQPLLSRSLYFDTQFSISLNIQ